MHHISLINVMSMLQRDTFGVTRLTSVCSFQSGIRKIPACVRKMGTRELMILVLSTINKGHSKWKVENKTIYLRKDMVSLFYY